MSVGEIEGDLDVFVGILNHDDAVVVNVCALPFALEENCATRLYFGRSELGRLKRMKLRWRTSAALWLELAVFAAGAPEAMKLFVIRQRETSLMALE